MTAAAAVKIVVIGVDADATAHRPTDRAAAAHAHAALAARAIRARVAALAAVRPIGREGGADGVPAIVGRARLQAGSAPARGARACAVDAVVAARAAVVVLRFEVCTYPLITIAADSGCARRANAGASCAGADAANNDGVAKDATLAAVVAVSCRVHADAVAQRQIRRTHAVARRARSPALAYKATLAAVAAIVLEALRVHA